MCRFLLAATLCLPCLFGAAKASSPNILVILVDDLGYGDLSSYGAEDMETPRIDALMAAGMRFDQFYANCTVCTPTRASLLTGRYPDMVGTPGVIRQQKKNNWGWFAPNGPTLPELLRTGGYDTAMVGKWHLGYTAPNLPNNRGFRHFHGFLGDMMDNYETHLRMGKNWMRLNEEEVDPKGHATEIFSNWAIEYLESRSKESAQPFFLYLAYNAPHYPIQPPESWLERVLKREPGIDKKRAANVAFVEHLDHEIGRVLDSLEQLKMAKNTLIVFSSDNGGSLPHFQSNGKLRGGKQEHWEGGIREPTCVVWPDHIKAGQRSNALGMTMDIMPSLCEIAGVKINHEIDGRSLAPLWLKGEGDDPNRTMIWVRLEGGPRYQEKPYYAIRRGDWKLLQNDASEPMVLVNLKEDPFEKNPLPAEGKIAEDLAKLLSEHIQKAKAVPWQEPQTKGRKK